MKESKGVYVTRRDIKDEFNKDYQFYANKVIRDREFSLEPLRYDQKTQEVGCQYDSRRDNLICTCRNLATLRKRQEVSYFGLPKQIYAYHGSRSFTDIGVGSVKAFQRKKVKKIYLPTTDDRGVGSSDLSTYLIRRSRQPRGCSYYDNKKTSSKCVGGILEYNTGCVMNEKLSPIVQTVSGSTSPRESAINRNIEIGSNTVVKSLTNTTTQVEETTDKDIEINSEIIVETIKQVSIVQEDNKEMKTKTIDTNNRTDRKEKDTEKEFSSDSLVQHVHNLENPSDDKQSHMSADTSDPMENKLEREYRRIFATKSKEAKSSNEKTVSDYKSTSTLKRRFEALRRGLVKKEDSKRNSVIIAKESSPVSMPSRKDVSINSDPPSLEGRSFSNTKMYSPFIQSYSRDQTIYHPRTSHYRRSVTSRKERDSAQWSSRPDDDDSECQGVKGMFKLWGKKFNLEEDYYKKNATPKPSYAASKLSDKKEEEPIIEIKPEVVVEEKKEGRKFFFFKKKHKDNKEKPYKSKKGVTTGRCEVRDGLMIKIGGVNPVFVPEEVVKEPEILPEQYEDLVRKAWLKKFLSQAIESRNSVQVRWNNKTYATSSSTVFELMDNVYKDTGVVFRSKSQVTAQSSYKSYTKQRVNFVHQNIEAWMIPKTFTDRPKLLPAKVKCKSDEERKDNIEVRISDQKWFIDKSKAFSHKIEVVLHSKNFVKLNKEESSEYLTIDIPKGFFVDSSSDDNNKQGGNQFSDEQVFKIVEYETGSDLNKDRTVRNFDIGDHKQNNIKVTVSVKEHKDCDSMVLETMIKGPPVHRDVVIQGSNVYIPKRCDVIGVGIITQRDLREIRKPILKIQDDFSDDESEHNVLRPNEKKCEFAQSYLQDYYRNWTPLGIDLYSWCVSDSHLRCCSENSKASFNNQGDVTKSCPNIFDDFQTAAILSSCGASSCSHCHTYEEVEKKPKKSSWFGKFKKQPKDNANTYRRVLPKDSLEVFKKRKIYALSMKSKWGTNNCCTPDSEQPYSVPSIESKGAQNTTTTECPKLMKSCCKPIEPKPRKRTCKKHVSLPDCDTMNELLAKQLADALPEGILAFKGTSGCDSCKKKEACPKHAKVNPTPSCEIPRAPCRDSCEKMKKPPCSNSKQSCEKPPSCPGSKPPSCPPTPPCDNPSCPASPARKSPSCPPSPPPPCKKPPSCPASPPSLKKTPSCPPSPPPCRKPPSCPPSPPVKKPPSCPPTPPSPPPCKKKPPPCPPSPPPCKKKPPPCPPSPPYKKSPPCPPSPPPCKKKSSPCPPPTPPCCRKPPPPRCPHTSPPCPPSPPPCKKKPPPCPPPPPPSLKKPTRCPPSPPSCPHIPPCPPPPCCPPTPPPPPRCPHTPPCLPPPPPCPPPPLPCPPPPKKKRPPSCPHSPPCTPPPPPCYRSNKPCPLAPRSCPTSPPSCCSRDPESCPAEPPPCKKASSNFCKKISLFKKKQMCPGSPPCKPTPCKPSFCKSLACQPSQTPKQQPSPCQKFSEVDVRVSYGSLSHPTPDAPFYYSPIHPCPPERENPRRDYSPCDSPPCNRHSSSYQPQQHEYDAHNSPIPHSEPLCNQCRRSNDEFPWPTKNQVSNQSSVASLYQVTPEQEALVYGTCKKNCPMLPKLSCDTIPSPKQECKASCPNRQGSPPPPCMPQMQCPPPRRPSPPPSPPRTPPPSEGPVDCKSKSKVSGLYLKMKPAPKKPTCSKDCLAWEHATREDGCISLNSQEKITIRLKKETPSTEEIREGLNIKVQDEDGMTLFERKDYRLQHAGCSMHGTSLLGDMYKASEVRRVTTNNSVQAIASKRECRKEITAGRSDASIANLIEIQFKLKVTQGEKTTEINIANDGDKDTEVYDKSEKEGHINNNPQEVFVVKNGGERPVDQSDQKNDINIRIVIKNFKPKSNKKKSVNLKHDDYSNEFAKQISAKFHTVSTGYSDVLHDDNVFSVHRATVDLTSSADKSKTHSNKSEEVMSEPLNEHGKLILSEQSVCRCITTDMSDSRILEEDLKSIPSRKYSECKEDTDTEKLVEHKYDTEETDTDKLPNRTYDTEETDTDKPLEHKYDTDGTDTDKLVEHKYDTFISTDTDEQDAIPEHDIEKSKNIEVIVKPHTKDEKKELLKHVFQKAHETKTKNKNRMRKLRDMLKVILTSDSSDHDETKLPNNDLAKDVTYASLKPNYFRDTDSMNNYYRTESNVLSDGEINRQIVYPTVENNSEMSNSNQSEILSSENESANRGCMCSTLAARLKLASRIGEGGGCCCGPKVMKRKNEETTCDLKKDSDYFQYDYKTPECVDVETQNSRYLTNKINSTNLSINKSTRSNSMVFAIPEVKAVSGIINVDDKHFNIVRRTFSPHRNHVRECEMRKLNRNTILRISDEDKIILLNKPPRMSKENTKAKEKTKQHRDPVTALHASDILQSYETKKAVLEIYTEKTVSDDGERLVAKLPKFVYERENEIQTNYEAMATNTYKAVCKKNIVMMAINR